MYCTSTLLGSKHEKILIHIFVSLCLVHVVRRCQGHFGLKMFTYVLVCCLYNLVYDRCIISISGIRDIRVSVLANKEIHYRY